MRMRLAAWQPWDGRLRALGLATLVGLSVAAPVATADAADGAPAPDRSPVFVEREQTVTLVTGDRVTVRPEGQGQPVSVQPGPGRERLRFTAQQVNGELHVMPADVSVLVGTGQLDERLFNVTRLLKFGYDDRSRADLPLIVTYSTSPAARLAGNARLTAAGVTVGRDLPSVAGSAVRERKADAAEFWTAVGGAAANTTPGSRSAAPSIPQKLAGGISRILLDGKVHATLDHSVPQIGAPEAWQAGYTGAGVTVAVLDTGIDTSHPDLADAVVGEQDFTASPSGPRDVVGHGTHVAGTITGNGAASAGKYVGVAPDASLLNGKVLDDTGSGSDSQVLAGMEWAAASGADIVNMSLGTEFPGDGTDVLDLAVNRLTAQTGTLFVIAAGNTGPADQTVGSPGSAEAALTVGAVDRNDQLVFFSSRGPRLGDLGIKPEITAPGENIVSARAGGGGSDQPYLALSGTSMATPHVAGAAALLASRQPEWRAPELKAALMGSARPNDALTVYQQGAGRVDVAAATSQDVYATPAAVHAETRTAGAEDTPPTQTTVTYHNAGAAPVTLTLDVTGRDPSGAPAPEGLFTVSAPTVTVPANATASVEVSTDTSGAQKLGSYSGRLTATGGSTTVVTPLGVSVEPPSHDVTVNFVDAQGNPTPAYKLMLINTDTGRAYSPYNPSGTATARVPDGHYYLIGTQYTDGLEGTMRAEPDLVVDSDQTLSVDARESTPIGITVDRPEAKVGDFLLGFRRNFGTNASFTFVFGAHLDGLRVVPSTSSVPDEQFRFFVEGHLARPDGSGGFRGSPYLYHAMWEQRGRIPENMVRRFRDGDFGVVESRVATTAPDQTALMGRVARPATPTTITEYFLPNYQWFTSLWMVTDPADEQPLPDSTQTALPRVVAPGSRTVERWNAGVFGPSFSQSDIAPFVYSYRTGGRMRIDTSMFSDQGANHTGWSAKATGYTTVYRDGTEIGTSPFMGFGDFDVTDDPARYEVVSEATQDAEELSTKISAKWTFTSAGDGTFDEHALPMAAIRFAPELDDHNRAPAGRAFQIPVRVERQFGATFGKPGALHVEVSYDDGRTWEPAKLVANGRNVLVQHPKTASYVSLRASTTDSAGNGVEQTIIRAYALKQK